MKRLPVCAAALFCAAALTGCVFARPQELGATPTPQPDAAPETLVTYDTPQDIDPYTGLARGEDYPLGHRGVAVMINNVRAAWP